MAGMLCGWRSGVALAMRHRPVVYPPMGSVAWETEMSTLPKFHSEYYGIFTFLLSLMQILYK